MNSDLQRGKSYFQKKSENGKGKGSKFVKQDEMLENANVCMKQILKVKDETSS